MVTSAKVGDIVYEDVEDNDGKSVRIHAVVTAVMKNAWAPEGCGFVEMVRILDRELFHELFGSEAEEIHIRDSAYLDFAEGKDLLKYKVLASRRFDE